MFVLFLIRFWFEIDLKDLKIRTEIYCFKDSSFTNVIIANKNSNEVLRSIVFKDRHLKSWMVNEVTNTSNTHRHYYKY